MNPLCNRERTTWTHAAARPSAQRRHENQAPETQAQHTFIAARSRTRAGARPADLGHAEQRPREDLYLPPAAIQILVSETKELRLRFCISCRECAGMISVANIKIRRLLGLVA
jgi:hypothetical protein